MQGKGCIIIRSIVAIGPTDITEYLCVVKILLKYRFNGGHKMLIETYRIIRREVDTTNKKLKNLIDLMKNFTNIIIIIKSSLSTETGNFNE